MNNYYYFSFELICYTFKWVTEPVWEKNSSVFIYGSWVSYIQDMAQLCILMCCYIYRVFATLRLQRQRACSYSPVWGVSSICSWRSCCNQVVREHPLLSHSSALHLRCTQWDKSYAWAGPINVGKPRREDETCKNTIICVYMVEKMWLPQMNLVRGL